jgi:DNA-binding SARP family transcriptional activator
MRPVSVCAEARMEFRLLGPLEVRREGKPLALGGQKQRALLALLLLHANEVVGTDRLIDALWGERPPQTAATALQGYVSQLRKLVGKERIVTQPPGYRLTVGDEELDLTRFQALVAESKKQEARQAADTLRDALALWRGPPLADLAYQPFAQAQIARLDDLRLASVEERIEADLALGRHAALVGELETLIAEHPLRERLRGQLMLALYRSRRQAEALEAYQAARRTLVEELGIDPSRSLQQLERQILHQDPALDLPQEADAAPKQAASLAVPSTPAPPATPEAAPVEREVRKTVTVVYAGVTSSATAGELDPESSRRLMNRTFAELRTALERHGGTVGRLAGDALTAFFGIPAVHEDDALRAVRAACEMRHRMQALRGELEHHWGARLDLRVAVSTGEVVTGGVTGQQPYATGEAVNFALRLGQSAEAGEILLANSTHRVVRRAVAAEPVESRDGEEAFRALRLLEVLPDLPSHIRRFESPMVGREGERRRLQDAFEQAVRDHSCHLFTVLGAAGVGKSRLVQEFLDAVAGRALITRGRCLPYGEGITFWPVMEAVKDAAALDDSDPPEKRQRQLAGVLEGEDQVELVAQRVAEVIGLAEAVGGVEEGFWAVRTFFEVLARRRPLVLVFDDIHWGETTFLDLLEHLADWVRDAPILLICIARPELLDTRPAWGGGKWNSTSILLEPLSDPECRVLVANLLARAELPQTVEVRIAQAAEGNPLFVEEMLAMLIDDGVLVREDGRWIATSDVAAVRAPPTIQAVLAARLDLLADEERTVIEGASVEGKVFHEGSVAALAPEPPRVTTSLATLVRKELVRPDRPVFSGERAYRFRHLLIRDVAYDSIPKESRAVLHERHADWLERKAGERGSEFEEIIGYHLEQAYRYRAELGPVDERARELARRAAERLGAAGRRAFVRDAPAAVNLISRAVSLLPPDDPKRVELVPSVRVIQGMSGDLSWANAVLSEAMTAGDERLTAHALVQRAFLRLFTEPDAAADELVLTAEQAIKVFETAGDELGLARAWRLVGQAHYLARRAGASAEAAERALAHARRAGNRFEEREIVEWLAAALVLGPAPAPEAAHRCERLLEDVRGDRALEIQVLGTLAYMVAIQGRRAAADELFARGRRIVEEGEWISWLFPIQFGFIRLWENDPVAAERQLRPAYEGLKRVGEKSHFSSIATLLAQSVYAQSRYQEAEELAVEAERAARPNDVHVQTISRTTRAKVLACRGELGVAEELAREGVAFVEASDFLPVHGDALMDLAQVLRLVGRADEARATLERAVEIYEEKGNVVAAARARAMLEP